MIDLPRPTRRDVLAAALGALSPRGVRLQVERKPVVFEARPAPPAEVLEHAVASPRTPRSLLESSAAPGEIADALAKIGLGDPGTWIAVRVEWEEAGIPKSARLEELLLDPRSKRPPAADAFLLQGGRRHLVGLRPRDPDALLGNPLSDFPEGPPPYRPWRERIPSPGTRLTVSLSPAPAFRRLHARIKGRVQGVGFRDFTERSASALKIRGWVRNLADGDVELLAEGAAPALRSLVEKVSTGPPASRVSAVWILEARAATGEFETFEIRY